MTMWDFLHQHQIWGLIYLFLILFVITTNVSLITRCFQPTLIIEDDEPLPSDELN